MTLNDILVNVVLNTGNAERRLLSFGRIIGGVAVAAGALASAFSFTKISSDIDGLSTQLDDLSQLALRTGINLDRLQAINLDAVKLNIDTSSLSEGLSTLSETTFDAFTFKTSKLDAFKLLDVQGLDSATGKVRPLESLLGEMSVAVKKLIDQGKNSEAFFALNEIFGDGDSKAFLKLLTQSDSAVRTLTESSNQFDGILSSNDISSLKKFREQSTLLSATIGQTYKKMIAKLSPSFISIAKNVNDWIANNRKLINQNFTAFVSRLGDIVSSLSSFFVNTLSSIINFSRGVYEAIDAVIGINNAIKILGGIALVRLIGAIGGLAAALKLVGFVAIFLLIEDFITYMHGGESAIGRFIERFKEFEKTSPILSKLAMAAGVAAAAIAGFAIMSSIAASIAPLVSAISGLVVVMGTLSVALAPVIASFLPFIAIAAAVSTALYALYSNWDSVSSFISENIISPIVDFIDNGFTGKTDLVINAWKKLKDSASGSIKSVVEFFSIDNISIPEQVSKSYRSAVEFFSVDNVSVPDTLKESYKSVVEFFSVDNVSVPDEINKTYKSIVEFISLDNVSIPNVVKESYKSVVEFVSLDNVSVPDVIKESYKSVVEFVSSGLRSIIDDVSSLFSYDNDNINISINAVSNGIDSALSNIDKILSIASNNIKLTIKSFLDTTASILIWNNLKSVIKDQFISLGLNIRPAMDMFSNLIDFFSRKWQSFKDSFKLPSISFGGIFGNKDKINGKDVPNNHSDSLRNAASSGNDNIINNLFSNAYNLFSSDGKAKAGQGSQTTIINNDRSVANNIATESTKISESLVNANKSILANSNIQSLKKTATIDGSINKSIQNAVSSNDSLFSSIVNNAANKSVSSSSSSTASNITAISALTNNSASKDMAYTSASSSKQVKIENNQSVQLDLVVNNSGEKISEEDIERAVRGGIESANKRSLYLESGNYL